MSQLEIHQIPVLDDNYVYLAHDTATGSTAVIDPAVAGPVLEALDAKGWKLTHILNTHHHGDHIGGNLELKQKTGCVIIGSHLDPERIDGIDQQVGEGDTVNVGDAVARVFDVPGHTRGHIAYWFEDSDALFSGDTLFALGCGRLFEGSPEQMWTSLSKFAELPDQTQIYCAHEYTQSNGKFALSVEPDNAELVTRMDAINAMRAKGLPTVPSSIGMEKATNPFLRPASSGLQRTIGLEGAGLIEVFAETRRLKDNF